MNDHRLRRFELDFQQRYGRETTLEERKFLVVAALMLEEGRGSKEETYVAPQIA